MVTRYNHYNHYFRTYAHIKTQLLLDTQLYKLLKYAINISSIIHGISGSPNLQETQ